MLLTKKGPDSAVFTHVHPFNCVFIVNDWQVRPESLPCVPWALRLHSCEGEEQLVYMCLSCSPVVHNLFLFMSHNLGASQLQVIPIFVPSLVFSCLRHLGPTGKYLYYFFQYGACLCVCIYDGLLAMELDQKKLLKEPSRKGKMVTWIRSLEETMVKLLIGEYVLPDYSQAKNGLFFPSLSLGSKGR